MDIKPSSQQAINDDQELAKVLAGITESSDNKPEDESAAPVSIPGPVDEPAPDEPAFIQTPAPEPTIPAPTPVADTGAPAAPEANGELDGIKQDALKELRPLVDKLDVSPEEKFDTYLLLLRSTDDAALIAPAFAAARAITDEARRAQALLDTIKEIDYLSGPKHDA